MSYYDYGYGYYTPTKPKEVKDGIKLESKKIGSTWWSKRWISALESFSNSSRLERGRKYARKGQVINFKIGDEGNVSAKVQGSASRPYSITIKIKTFSDNEWDRILKEMSGQALFLAKLLNGEMPEDIEEAFSKAGVSLFPKNRSQIETDCSCPDWENPCKHIAAVHYVLGEEFDRDPFMIFKLRGRTEAQVTAELQKLRSFEPEPEKQSSHECGEDYEVRPLDECMSDFWLTGDDFKKISVSITPPTVPLALLKRLGTPPFWQDEDLWAGMERIYRVISDSAIKEAYSPEDYGVTAKKGEETDTNLNPVDVILHGTWIPAEGNNNNNNNNNNNKGRFLLWGERIKPGAENEVKKKSAKKKTIKKIKIPEHPFCTSADELIELTRAAGFDFRFDELPESSLIVSLPGSEDMPHASFRRLEDMNPGTKTVTEQGKLSGWKVNAFGASAEQAITQLAHLPLNDISHDNVKIKFGNDILFWSMLAKFGFELIARQRFIPSVIEPIEGDLYARWHPVYNCGEDSKRINLFINSIPTACGAAAETGDRSLSGFSPAKLIINFLNAAVDETCRSWIRSKIAKTAVWEKKMSGDSLPARLLSSLSSVDGAVKGSTHQRSVLKTSVEKWTHAIKSSGKEAPFRTCFRLEEPQEESIDVYGDKHEKKSEWHVSFHLQAIDDPSLLVPAETVWKSKSLKYMEREFEHPHEMFLGDLAKAARLFPSIERSLKTRRPESCGMEAGEAYGFLKEGAWLLEESGYGILIPSWWSKKGAAADIRIKAKSKSPAANVKNESFFGMNSIINFKWEVAIGDEIISREELERLSNLKVPLVKVRGQWVEFKKDRIDDALKILDKFENNGMTLASALRINAGVEDIGVPMEFESSGWLKNILAKDGEDGSGFENILTPESFNGTLRPYQVSGFSWLSFLKNKGIGTCLADDMGLGKTIQVISLLLHNKDVKGKNKKTNPPVLLVAPTSVIGNWHHELAKFAPSLNVMIHHGLTRLSGRKLIEAAKKQDVVVTTYALSVRDQKDLNKIQWEGVILDEAQNIKNPYTKQARSIKNIGSISGYRIALTGTPIENRLSELWSVMEFLNPGYFGTFNEFMEKFAIPIERYKNQNVSDKLKNMVKPFILRRLKTDRSVIKDLPEKMEMKTYCTLTIEQTTLYKAVVDDMMQEIEESKGMQRKGLVLSALTKLKQICNHPALFLHDESSLDTRSGKLERLKDMLDNVLAANERALIFTQYSEMGGMLKSHLEEAYGREVFFLHGGIPQKKRDLMVTCFQEDKNAPQIFILSVKAGGLGLNLTSANHVFHFDRWWNPAVENQATDRSFRIGQKKNVQVYKFITEGTLEEKIDEMIESKKELSDRVLSAGESMLTELSNEKLREMFSLREKY